jgi:predicted DNA-binding transcriptional regulator AlpA
MPADSSTIKGLEQLIKPAALAKAWGMSASWIYEKAATGELPAVKFPCLNAKGEVVRYSVRFRPADAQDFIARHRVTRGGSAT